MLIVLTKVTSIFGLILVGYAAYKLKILGDDSISVITSLILNITCPCLLISSMYSKTVSEDLLDSTIMVVLFTIIFYVAAALLTVLFLRIFKIGSREDWKVYIPAVGATNSGFMGFPVVKALFGNDMLYLQIMSNFILNIYLMGILPAVFRPSGTEKLSFSTLIRRFLNPIMISMLVGLVMMLGHVRPPGVIDEMLNMLGDITVPASMVLVGIQLGNTRLRDIVAGSNLAVSVFAMVVLPVLTLGALYPLSFISYQVKMIIVMTASYPTAVLAVVIADQCDADSGLMSQLVSLTTLISVATVPITAMMLTALYL